MALDPIISIAVSLQARKGVYSLLLGSGVSRPSGIPTAWEVVVDLIHRVADLVGEQRPADPAQWYKEKFSGEPSYSHLLGELAKSPADRSHLLRSYFEPTDEERDEGLKVPTAAHRAIAQLVRDGYVKVILTTNFDRLMEQALAEIGISPNVVLSPASLEGMTPLQHADCTIVKLHGDYMDLDTKNTLDELSEYTPEMDRLLDRLLSEYGLVVCGWSGEWDHALRDAITRSTRHRFSTYWLARGSLSDGAKQVVSVRGATQVEIASADDFFVDLAEKVKSIDQSRVTQPLSREIAIATTKRLLSEERFLIRLEDLIRGEADRLFAVVSGRAFAVGSPNPDKQSVIARAERADVASVTLGAMLSVGCFWGTASHFPIWKRALERVASVPGRPNTSYNVWTELRLLPAAFVLYAAGISAIAAEKYGTLNLLLTGCLRRDSGKEKQLIDGVAAQVCVQKGIGSWLYPTLGGDPKTPGSDWLHDRLKPSLSTLVGGEERFTELFSRFEFFLSMAYFELARMGSIACVPGWMPHGRYIWNRSSGSSMSAVFRKEVLGQRAEWPPLVAGMFSGNPEIAIRAIKAIEEHWGDHGI